MVEIKTLKVNNAESAIHVVSAHTIHIEVKDIDACGIVIMQCS